MHYYDVSQPTSNNLTLHGMILNKKVQLLEAFRLEDSTKCGKVSSAKWTEVMQRVVGVKIQWHMLIAMIVPVACIVTEEDSIHYEPFLTDFEERQMSDTASLDGLGQGAEDDVNYFLVESLYLQARQLEDIFNFFDEESDGIILLEGLEAGCAYTTVLLCG